MNTSDDINYIVNHLFLPPKLPQEEDVNFQSQNALLSHVVESAAAFYRAANDATADGDVCRYWSILHKMLSSMQTVRQGAYIDLQIFQRTVEDMCVNGTFTTF
jgi:Family of unknown function (DUF6606)